jgi:hypothetical protein
MFARNLLGVWGSCLAGIALAMAGGCAGSAPAKPDGGGGQGGGGNDAGAEMTSVADSGNEMSEDSTPGDAIPDAAQDAALGDALPDSTPDAFEAGVDAVDASSTLNQGLIAYYPFDGDTKDHSGNGNDCTPVGTGVTSVADRHGNPGGAYQLEGSSSMDCGTGSSLNVSGSLTISAWINADPVSLTGINRNVVSGGSYDFGITNQTIASFGFCDETNGPFLYVASQGGGRGVACSTTPLMASSWHQLVGVYEAGQFVNVYLDGNEVQSIAQGIPATITASTQHLYIGANVGANYAAYFSGSLDELRIYGRALSTSEIAQLP